MPALAVLFVPFVWLATKIAALISAAFAFIAVTGSKKLGLAFTFTTMFATLLYVFLACINFVIVPLIAPLAMLSGPLFLGLSYVIPPVFDLAISSIVSVRVCVWVFMQHYILVKLVSES